MSLLDSTAAPIAYVLKPASAMARFGETPPRLASSSMMSPTPSTLTHAARYGTPFRPNVAQLVEEASPPCPVEEAQHHPSRCVFGIPALSYNRSTGLRQEDLSRRLLKNRG
ncbi:hypothetical protein GCM10025774_12840 [Microbacterium kyungheense]